MALDGFRTAPRCRGRRSVVAMDQGGAVKISGRCGNLNTRYADCRGLRAARALPLLNAVFDPQLLAPTSTADGISPLCTCSKQHARPQTPSAPGDQTRQVRIPRDDTRPPCLRHYCHAYIQGLLLPCARAHKCYVQQERGVPHWLPLVRNCASPRHHGMQASSVLFLSRAPT